MINKERIKQELNHYKNSCSIILRGKAPFSDYAILATCYILGALSYSITCAIF